MRRLLFSALMVVALAAPAKAQSTSYGCCSFHDWATYGSNNLLRYHPTADFMGGTGMILVARGPWFAKSFRDRRWKRLSIVALGAGLWQYQNLKEIQGYRWDYAAYDFTATVGSAFLVDLLIEEIF